MSTTPNPIRDTWVKIDLILADAKSDRLKLGEHCLRLQALYSNKSADVRRFGVGTFEQELGKRNLKTRTVREWISDFKADQSGNPSSATKRRARRKSTTEYERGYRDGYAAAKAHYDEQKNADGDTREYLKAAVQ